MQMRLVTFDHPCLNVDHCGVRVVSRVPNGGGVTRKLLLGLPGKRGVFVPSVDDAIQRAAKAGYEISQEDLETCRLRIS